ncbi:sushi repeat-containing protein SRPX isoform X1 [Hemiscyllium ocellatum]|uniref:sushi repeat-containing protein SRPX isoform X1 n=1 Tax=Hemiscyllium ocellatum TaxID=170820 RepID=UPI002966B2EC|nr:sushi repeat-containing protein SRPX isoform X1 [Hemiscyllium ocellatum]
MDIPIKCIFLSTVCIFTAEAYGGSGYTPLEDDEDAYANEARYAKYEDIPRCAPLKIKNGYVRCRTPQGGYYKNVQGTMCDISCQKGYEIHGTGRVHCLSSKRWSQTVTCREIRCPKFSLPLHGSAKCSDGAYFNSRCEFYCTPGYQVRGQKSVVCMHNKKWSGKEPSCLDLDPPKIRCPSLKVKTAEPEKLTVRVNWDTPEGKDSADGILTNVILKGLPPRSEFSEGQHKIQYTVFDGAGNKASCQFTIKVEVRRCGKLSPPDNGSMKCTSDGDNYGATCEFSCMGGYELRGSKATVCQYNNIWSAAVPSCAPMHINVGVTTATALLDQFYEKRRLLIISTPSGANHYYRFQLGIIQQAICGFDLRHVTVIELVGVYPVLIGRIRERFLSPPLVLQLRLLLRISQSSFNMVLIDKYGMDKERYPFPVTAAELFTLIDTFSLRKEEIKLQIENGQSCN